MCETKPAARGTYPARIVRNQPICDEHYHLVLGVDRFPSTSPGQFVQLLCRPPQPQADRIQTDWPDASPPALSQPELTDTQTLLRRPFSLAGRTDAPGSCELEIIYRTIGTGTRWLATARAGETLSVLGPLGNSFPIDPARPACAVVGGGVGIPPMLYLARSLRERGLSVTAFCGARSGRLLPLESCPAAMPDPTGRPTRCMEPLAEWEVPVAVTTDDGTLGRAGFVHSALAAWIDGEGLGPDSLTVYACGPEAMMRAVAELCLERRIACHLALERRMACGMGTCQSCIVRVHDPASAAGWSYKLCCADGPVFPAESILWDPHPKD